MVQKPKQEEWNGVYYDASVGEFFMMDVGEDAVTFLNPFTGEDVEDIGFVEFYDLNEEGNLYSVSEQVVNDPVRCINSLLDKSMSAVDGLNTNFHHLNSIDVDFSIQATDISINTDDAFYHSVE